MRFYSKNACLALAALAVSAAVILSGCEDEIADSASAATSSSQDPAPATASVIAPVQATAAAGQSDLLSTLTSDDIQELVSGSTTLAQIEKKRLGISEEKPAVSAAAASQAEAASSSAASTAEKSEPAATASSNYEDEVQDLLNQLYAVKAQAESGLNSAIQSAKSQYAALPADQKTQSKKMSIVMSKASELNRLQSSCDQQVNAIVNKMREVLKANGQSTALADQVLASYESQKASTYSSLKSQLMG